MILVTCPHCECIVEILEINCAIFRHGIYKKDNKQIHPHAPKEECDILFSTNKIYGCGKPFRILQNNKNEYIAEICDYI
jgi:hypothetical protein